MVQMKRTNPYLDCFYVFKTPVLRSEGDIHLLQNQHKYENQKKIKEIKIGENIYSGTKDVFKAIDN